LLRWQLDRLGRRPQAAPSNVLTPLLSRQAAAVPSEPFSVGRINQLTVARGPLEEHR
jgi:hypothetical protein